jgi:guanylate kinase
VHFFDKPLLLPLQLLIMDLPRVLVLTGPTCSGKTTLKDALLARSDRYTNIRTCTSRPQRDGEPDDAYFFVTREEFKHKIDTDQLVEYSEYGGNLYGMPWSELQRAKAEGRVAVVVLDRKGLKNMLDWYLQGEIDCRSVLLCTPEAVRRQRAIQRDSTDAIVDKRASDDAGYNDFYGIDIVNLKIPLASLRLAMKRVDALFV